MLPDPCLIFCQSETLSFPSKNLDVSRGEVTSNCFPLINHLTERLLLMVRQLIYHVISRAGYGYHEFC